VEWEGEDVQEGFGDALEVYLPVLGGVGVVVSADGLLICVIGKEFFKLSSVTIDIVDGRTIIVVHIIHLLGLSSAKSLDRCINATKRKVLEEHLRADVTKLAFRTVTLDARLDAFSERTSTSWSARMLCKIM
jgi:hypothetical protein